MAGENDTTKSETSVVTKLSEEEQKRIFSCIPAVVEEIERFIENVSRQNNFDDDHQKLLCDMISSKEGIKFDQNNRVVKIKHNSIWLQQSLLEHKITTPNPYTFYIGSHRDGIDGEPNSPNSLDSLKSSDSDDSFDSSDSRKVFAKFSKKHAKDEKSVVELGKGSFGKVQLVTTGDQKVAMKKINLNLIKKEEEKQKIQKEIENEIQALKIMGQYKDHIMIDGNMYIYMDYIPGVSLQDKLNDPNKLQEAEKVLIAENLGNELMKLHTEGVFHRDIKPGNVIYNSQDQKATFIDFGSTKTYVRGQISWSDIEKYVSEYDGMTQGYVPPEADMREGTLLNELIVDMPQNPQKTTVDDEQWTEEQKKFLETEYAPHAYANIDIFQLGKVFSDMELPKELWEQMTKTNPLQRLSLEGVKQEIQKYKDIVLQQEQSSSVTGRLQQLQERDNMLSQTSSTLKQRDTTDLQQQLLAGLQQLQELKNMLSQTSSTLKQGHKTDSQNKLLAGQQLQNLEDTQWPATSLKVEKNKDKEKLQKSAAAKYMQRSANMTKELNPLRNNKRSK